MSPQPCPILITLIPLLVSQVAALNPDGSLFFSSVTGGAGVSSWTSVTVAGAGFKTAVPRRVTWAGEGIRSYGLMDGAAICMPQK